MFTKVYCDLYGLQDGDFTHLHGNISYLRLRVINPFDPDLRPLEHIHGLKELIVDKTYLTEGWSNIDFLMYFNSTKSPHPFALLERLDIPIPMRKIDAAIFKHMEHLKYLNLSHTRGLISSDIRQVLQALSYAGAPLESLDLSWSRCSPDLPWDKLNIREDILKNLAMFPLKVLDLRAADLLEVDVGFAEFTPGLEKIYFGEYEIPVKNRDMEYCIWLDISILPNIIEIAFDLGPWDRNIDSSPCPGAWPEIHLLSSINITDERVPNCSALYEDNACRLSRCTCYSRINNYPLLRGFIRNLRYTEVDDGHVAFPPFPVPPKLEYLSISPKEMRFRKGYMTLLQHDIALTHLHYDGWDSYGEKYQSYYGLEKLVSELKNLTVLHLQIGRIEDQNAIWNDMPKLESLNIGLSFLDVFEYSGNPFFGCPNLLYLNLSGCKIFSPLGFSSLTKLQSLDLSRNTLWDIPSSVTTFLDSRAAQGGLKLYLSQNQLRCDCKRQEFFRWVISTKVHFPDQNDIRCLHPRRSWINPWHLDPVEVRYCKDFYLILTAAGSSFGSICMLMVLLLIIRKRRTIQYWLHAARTSWKKKQSSNAGCRRDYRYSAFVAYCSQEEEERKWVHLTLAPKLEQEYGFKLCMHHRDFMPGNDIADNIVESIHDSNKVLLILSPTFLESHWC